MSSKLDWGVFTPADREEVAIVGEAVGPNGTLSLSPKNFKNADKRVVVILKREDGTSTEPIVCSQSVSDGLRAKEITVSNLFNFSIYEQTAMNGETYLQIGMPSGAGSLMEFKNTGGTEYSAPVVEAEELVAF